MKSSRKFVMKAVDLLHAGWLVMQLEVQGEETQLVSAVPH
jgi:hypothetical protein